MTIDFNNIRDIFSDNQWDVSYLSEENLKRSSSAPIKVKLHVFGHDMTNAIHSVSPNGIIIAKYSTDSNDYSLYRDSYDKLLTLFNKEDFSPVYVNFKEASILSGFGVRAKNSLVYNRKFGFQCKFCAYVFKDKIVNCQTLEANHKTLDLCEGCDDCIKNCPVNAIHEDWIDAEKCDNFIGYGNDPNVSSLKWFWYEKMKPKNVSKEEVYNWDSHAKYGKNITWGNGVDGFYELTVEGLMKDKKPVKIPHCRKCQEQPKCSKAPFITEQ
jgi:Pyruvate/2-oxoacid:ferredoxin oxidoreductase delta subunit